ncbi:MAG: formylglycine-generating enzyme family protein [Mariprofundaceae bacterium]|nr:formylglycine-generating enzyme family protein [Mariprofundaceae bacterium]
MKKRTLSPQQLKRRKKVGMATLITCVTVAMVGGSLHVMELGSMRMNEMRAKASYDLEKVDSHIRAAGEDLHLQEWHEKKAVNTYSEAEARALLSDAMRSELNRMMTIPKGEFLMGTNLPRANEQNKPQHLATLPDYQIDKYPVSQAQYALFVAVNHYRPPLNWEKGHISKGMEKHPITMISWYNARDYCTWQGKHLPLEAQWEKAARGMHGQRWPWGNHMKTGNLNVYYKVGHTTAVDAYPEGASPYGVMDMAGNVQEWTATEFKPYPGADAHNQVFHPKKLDASYTAGSEDKERVIYFVMRGGSWKSDPFSAATYHRNFSLPNYASDFFGFRCAKE